MMDQEVREFVHEMRIRPQIGLPRHWFGLKQKPVNTTPAGWRETFIVERDAAKNPVDKENFERILKVISIAEECGATNLAFGTKMEKYGTTYDKFMFLDEIWFPKKEMILKLGEFQRRLKEIY
ncbi:MAG: hypothetical protein IJX99_09865 [Clostridia bacterium]|nr:hypothetical protein [Clostridia bacterium]